MWRRLLRYAAGHQRPSAASGGQVLLFPRRVSPLAVTGRILLILPHLGVNTEGISMRGSRLTDDMSRPVLGLVDRRPALKPHRRRHMVSEAIITRACRGESSDAQGGELHMSQWIRPVRSVWPIVRGRVRGRAFIFSPLRDSNLLQKLRSVGAPLCRPGATTFGRHPFRGGAARGLMFVGGTCAQLFCAGKWRWHAARH